MQAQFEIYRSKMDEIENRMCRCNVRVMGLPEGSEGPALRYLWKIGSRGFSGLIFFHLFSLLRERTESLLGPLHRGGRPRPMIIKLFCYKDKVTLTQKSREKGEILYNGIRISLYPDYSPDLQKRRAGFMDVKRALRSHKISYALLYPVRLRVEALGTVHFFDAADRATVWLEDNKKNL